MFVFCPSQLTSPFCRKDTGGDKRFKIIGSDLASSYLKETDRDIRLQVVERAMELFTLETERLRLRPLTMEDVEPLHQLLDIEPDVWKFDPGYARSLEERIECVERRLQQY